MASKHLLKYFILFLGIAISLKGVSQVLDNANLNLNPGGYINDVIYDQAHNSYIIVGNFTQINGINRLNLAFIDASTMAVKTDSYANPIAGMDGEIRCVALTQTFTLGVYTYHLFIGGNFSYVNTGSGNITRLGIAKLVAGQSFIPPSHSNFTVNAWNAEIDMTPLLTGTSAEGVDDILISNDTVIFSGAFMAVNEISGPVEYRDGVAAYLINGSAPLNYPLMASGPYNMSRYYCLRKKGSNLFVGGYVGGEGLNNGRLFKLDASGNKIITFNYNYTNLQSVYSFELVEDSLIFVIEDRYSYGGSADNFFVVRQSNGTEKLSHSLSPSSSNMISNVAGPVNSMCVYEQNVYVKTGGAGEYVVGVESEGTGPVINSPDWNASVPAALTTNIFGNVHVARNKLFVSATNLSSLSGQPRLRLGSYCLPPKNVNSYTAFDSTVCAGQTVTYSIPMSDYADGYKWEYTGTGAFLVGHGPLDSPIELDGTTQNSKLINWTSNFTPGVLKIIPYTLCNGSTKVYGKAVALDIHSNPLPHINAGNDTTISCYNELSGVNLFGYSDSAVVSYSWNLPDPLIDVSTQNALATLQGNYIFSVTSPLGCINSDTISVSMDTIKPNVTIPSPPYLLTCATDSLIYYGASSSPHTTFEWYQGTTYFADPIYVTVVGSYFLEVTDTLNGCTKALGIAVETDFDSPNIQISGYPFFNPADPVDTLTCITPVLNLTCFSDSSNTNVQWMEEDTSAFYGNTLAISSGGFYHIFATDADNGCTNSLSINISEYLNGPGVGTETLGELNCSNDSLQLYGASLTTGATTQWNGPGVIAAANPIVVYDPGTYYITATHPYNGCESIDSVIVTETNNIDVDAGNDVLICDNEITNLSATYSGTISGISYLWNNGSTTNTASFNSADFSYAIVDVNGDNGCHGTDTVYIEIPPTPVIEFTGFKPCDDGPSGYVVASPVSGLDPFSYSIDNGISFQSSTTFANLYQGTYPILVRDSINCEYSFTAIIDDNSALPTPVFLFSTYNFESDTVAIIDVSNPPADSVVWVFPNDLIVIDANVSAPVIILPDTGIFEITMQAYYGNCLVEISKMIYSSPYDTLNATLYNSNGIKSIELYPNPTTGNFTVEVEFYKSQRSAMAVQDMLGNNYFFQEYDESLIISQDIFLDLSVLDGSYVLNIVSEFDSASITFILAR